MAKKVKEAQVVETNEPTMHVVPENASLPTVPLGNLGKTAIKAMAKSLADRTTENPHLVYLEYKKAELWVSEVIDGLKEKVTDWAFSTDYAERPVDGVKVTKAVKGRVAHYPDDPQSQALIEGLEKLKAEKQQVLDSIAPQIALIDLEMADLALKLANYRKQQESEGKVTYSGGTRSVSVTIE